MCQRFGYSHCIHHQCSNIHSQYLWNCNFLFYLGLISIPSISENATTCISVIRDWCAVQTFLKLSLSPSLPTDLLSLMTERIAVPWTHVAAREDFIVFHIGCISLTVYNFTIWIAVVNPTFKRIYMYVYICLTHFLKSLVIIANNIVTCRVIRVTKITGSS
jgi:hypothetical protein